MNLRQSLNLGSPQSAHDAARILQMGDVLRKTCKATLRRVAPAADAAQLGTVQQFALDPEAPAAYIFRAYSRTATAGTGELTVDAPNTTPGSGHIGVAPNGGIVVLAADAHVDVDVEYLPAEGNVITLTNLPVVPSTGVCAIPPKYVALGLVYLMDANATSATTVGRKNVRAPAAGAPATGLARLDVAKATVQFAVADAVTVANVVLYVTSAANLDTMLQSDSNLI